MTGPYPRVMRRFWLTATALAGCMFQFGWIPSCRGALTTVNPCGTVFAFCEASDVDLIFSDVPNYSIDPTCTLPGFGFPVADGGVPTNTSPTGCADQPVYPTTPGPRP